MNDNDGASDHHGAGVPAGFHQPVMPSRPKPLALGWAPVQASEPNEEQAQDDSEAAGIYAMLQTDDGADEVEAFVEE